MWTEYFILTQQNCPLSCWRFVLRPQDYIYYSCRFFLLWSDYTKKHDDYVMMSLCRSQWTLVAPKHRTLVSVTYSTYPAQFEPVWTFCCKQVNQWCESGIYLLASQAVDKCQSQEGAESALTDIQGFLVSAEKNQLTELKNLHNQYEVVLSEDIKVRCKQMCVNRTIACSQRQWGRGVIVSSLPADQCPESIEAPGGCPRDVCEAANQPEETVG